MLPEEPTQSCYSGRHIRAINRFLSSQKRKCSTETDLKPEAVPEKNALPFCKYTNLYQTLPVEKRLSGHLMSPVSQWAAEKDPINSKIRLVFENCSLLAVTSDV